jgi:hypothetical protein
MLYLPLAAPHEENKTAAGTDIVGEFRSIQKVRRRF